MSKVTAAVTAILALSIGLALPLIAAGQQVSVDTSNVRAQDTPMGNLIRVPIERTQINDFVYHVSGLANVYLVNTSDGSIIIDTGFAHQAPRQMELLKEVATGPIKYIFLPQGQHDDVGGIPLVKEAGTEIIMTRSSMEYMPYRSSVRSYLLPRYAVLYSWTNELAEQAKKQATAFPYTPITPDILVEDHIGYQFELGGVKFEVIALPGAEGINSAGLWLPDHKIMFAGGGSVGPEIPMWPNIGTVRADRNRILSRFIDTINTLIELEPEILLPGQDDPIIGKEHWAFQPLAESEPPVVKAKTWPRAAIDAFVLARLESAKLKPTPDADRRTLLRRVYIQLIGKYFEDDMSMFDGH